MIVDKMTVLPNWKYSELLTGYWQRNYAAHNPDNTAICCFYASDKTTKTKNVSL